MVMAPIIPRVGGSSNELVEPLLIVRRAPREQIVILHRRLLAIVRDHEVCRRLMTIPGVGETAS